MMAQSAVPAGAHLSSINQSLLAANSQATSSQSQLTSQSSAGLTPSLQAPVSVVSAAAAAAAAADLRKAVTPVSSTQPGATQTSSIRLSPLLGVAPLGPKKLTKEHHHQAEMLMAAYQHVPHPSDSERLR